jgi:membrane protease YdiL (CAAX protease family)
MLVLMVGYILFATLKGAGQPSNQPALSPTVPGLLLDTLLNLSLFGFLFGIGAWAAHPRASDLYADRPTTAIHWLLGFVWSVLLRVAIAIPILLAALVLLLLNGEKGMEKVSTFRPRLENLLDLSALADPLYALLCITWGSFVVAALREELWRAAMLGGIRAIAPASWSRLQAEWLGISISSVLFGIAHLTQGWPAVVMTTLIGFVLGSVQVYRRSLAEAVIAHGFFDATTFAILAVFANAALLRSLGLPNDLLQRLLDR